MSASASSLLQQLRLLMQARDWRAAALASDRLTAEHPELFSGWIARGQIALALGQRARACEAAAAARSRAGDDPLLWDAIGTLYSRAGDQPRALEAYERALALAPDNPQILFNRAAVRRFFGALAEAESDYDRVIALLPADYDAYKNRSDLRTQSPEHNHVTELVRLLGGAQLQWRAAVQLHYALAKEYEDLGEYARSFQQLRQGAQLRREHMRYDPAPDLATVDWIIEAFAASVPAAVATLPVGTRDAPIFIVGMPRSGSTLVERILSSHSEVHAAGELRALALTIVEAVQRRTGPRPLSRRELIAASAGLDFAALGRDYLERARLEGAVGERFIDKMPLNYLYCGLIRRALPAARIVHVSRAPMAACYAMYKTLFEDAYPFSYDLTELGRYYLAYRRLMQHWQSVLPGAILELSYETLIADQLGETRRLLEFCGLEWQQACIDFHRNPAPTTTASAAQVRRPIYDSSVAQWRHYRQQLRELTALLAAGGCDVD